MRFWRSDEVALLRRAGLDDAAITAAMTTTPLAFWGVTPAVELELARDPRPRCFGLARASRRPRRAIDVA